MDRKKTVIMKKDVKRRMKKQTIEKKIVNKIRHKILNWTKKGNNIKINEMRNKRKHKISCFTQNSH